MKHLLIICLALGFMSCGSDNCKPLGSVWSAGNSLLDLTDIDFTDTDQPIGFNVDSNGSVLECWFHLLNIQGDESDGAFSLQKFLTYPAACDDLLGGSYTYSKSCSALTICNDSDCYRYE